jgi:hypothetical protein
VNNTISFAKYFERTETMLNKLQNYKNDEYNYIEKRQRKELVSILEKRPCKILFNCPRVHEDFHCEIFYHVCPSASNCVMTHDTQHINSFTHPCKYGLNCRTKEKTHLVQFQHPISILKKKECPLGSSCGKTSEEFHKDEYFHPCQFGEKCKNLEDEIHINRFTHPCKLNYCKNNEEIHLKQFLHEKIIKFDPQTKENFSSVAPLKWDFFILPNPQEDSFKGIFNSIKRSLFV